MTTVQLIDELLAATLQEPADATRIRDVQQSLAKQGDEAIRQLDSLLVDSSANVREVAADVLELIGTETAYDKLVEFALRYLDDPTHQTKLPGPGWRRLRQLGKPVLPAMARHYDSSLAFATRLVMIFIAQQIGDPAARPLIDRALSEYDPRLVEAAGEALGSVDGPDAYDRLLQLLNSKDDRHRLAAIRGFGRLGSKAAVRPLVEALASADQTASAGGGSRRDERFTVREEIAEVIDSLTGESLKGDVNKIRAWWEAHSI
jgi:HEAT repeat protein